jgi:cytoskeletal protein RodZ
VVSIYNKRNAAVGYITLKAASRALKRRRQRRSGLKLGLYIGLGLVSVGILAAVAVIAVRRQNGVAAEEPEEGSASTDAEREDESEIVGEYVTAAPEPIPAT